MRVSVGGDGWQPEQEVSGSVRHWVKRGRVRWQKRLGRRPFGCRVRWVHGFQAECQADWRYLGGLTGGREGQEIQWVKVNLSYEFQSIFWIWKVHNPVFLWVKISKIKLVCSNAQQGCSKVVAVAPSSICLSFLLSFHNPVSIWLSFDTLFIPIWTWEAELGGSQAGPKDLVTRG